MIVYVNIKWIELLKYVYKLPNAVYYDTSSRYEQL